MLRLSVLNIALLGDHITLLDLVVSRGTDLSFDFLLTFSFTFRDVQDCNCITCSCYCSFNRICEVLLCLVHWSLFSMDCSSLLSLSISAQTNATDQAALVSFWKGLTNANILSWNTEASLCGQNWVECTGEKVTQL